jgi:glycerophosphoryl diester phosphodiesterase
VKAGTQLLELDVHLTKDNQVVVVHDPNLSRLTGRNLDVTQLRYDELPLLQKQLAVTFSKGTHPST